jgi:hypothetical protein
MDAKGKGTSKDSGQQFAFVIVNGQEHEDKATSLRDVRAHAMREALRQKKLTKNTPERIDPLPYKTGRFRLTPSQSKPKKQRSRIATKDVDANKTRIVSPADEDDDENATNKALVASTSSSLTHLEPSGLIDPFLSLPIKLGPRQEKLLYFCKSRMFYTLFDSWKCFSLHSYIHSLISSLLSCLGVTKTI